MKGKLILIPTPIDELGVLEGQAKSMLESACEDFDRHLLLVEDLKPARRRWSAWGLPREAFEHFEAFNEHTMNELEDRVISEIKKGKTAYLMSDGGLPAFCDPGQRLVHRAHQEGIRVSASPFPNSISLAVALSGFNSSQFFFVGFPPREKEERQAFLKKHLSLKTMSVWMDTPYRLKRLLEELIELDSNREATLCMDLNQEAEEILNGSLKKIYSRLKDYKREFVLVLK